MIKVILLIFALGIMILISDHINSNKTDDLSEKVYLEYLAYRERNRKGEHDNERTDI